jgi:predicted transposase YbfD/YdcC
MNIVTIAICAVICGADDFVAIARFGRTKRKWLSQFLDLRSGIPSHDRFNAVLAAIKPAEFEACLLSWITALHEITAGQIVAIDGKTPRRSFDAASGKSAIHMVSAWATANHITLKQVVVDQKSNEITAIPKLLKMPEIAGSLVTIDAMGCQTKIAQTIVDSQADYVLAVKENQPTLYDGSSWFFLTQREEGFADVRVSYWQTFDEGHGRKETRTYYVCCVPRDLPDRQRWPKLAAIGWTINDTMRGGKRCYEMRYYIMSRKLSAQESAAAVRGHWSIENSLHWQLDVTLGEDQSRLRRGRADANFSILRRPALSLLKNNKTLKVGVKNKRLAAGWDDAYLQQVLFGQCLNVQSPWVNGLDRREVPGDAARVVAFIDGAEEAAAIRGDGLRRRLRWVRDRLRHLARPAAKL